MQKKHLSLLGAGLVLAALLIWFVSRSSPDNKPRGDLHADLQERVATQPKPSLSRLPSLPGAPSPAVQQATPAAASPAPATAGKTSPALSEDQLAELRRAFEPPRFATDPAHPRHRQIILSNRLILCPETRTLPESASGRQTPTSRGTTPFVVQFDTPVSAETRQLLTDAGAVVRGFLPNNAVLTECTSDALKALAALAPVHAAEEFLPSDKIQPFLSSLLAAHAPSTRVRAAVQTFAPQDAETAADAIRAAGGSVEAVSADSRWGSVQALIPLSAVRTLAALGEVQWIEERGEIRQRNDQAAIPSHLNSAAAWQTWGLTGKGQVVGHADTGLDTGSLATMHPDFQGRIRALIARARLNDASDPNGHGTHTAGSILGSGSASGGQFRGTAWEAELVHQSVMAANGSFSGLPLNLYPFYQESYDLGARIHSDSWGWDSYGYYDTDCRDTDLFAWDNPEHLAVFASGNAGRDSSNSDGIVDTGAVGSPASAKNIVTVGATENDRPAGTGGYTSSTWYSAWPSWFPANPIRSDYISYSATTSPYRQGMAAFSSRGPTQDGRVKPDVVAPGTDVISTRSSVGGSGWGSYSGNSRYCFMGGTSMATPLTAGAAALMRQYAVERGGITNPSAALLKAMLLGGARSLTPGQYGTGATREIPAASPNNVEGWGQPDLAEAVHPTNRMVRLFDRIPAATGQTNTFTVSVTSGGAPLDIALVWLDYPATAGAGVTLVNDLDLLVVAPGGTLHHPNNGSSADRVNTSESIRLTAAAAGDYQIHVIGHAVPYTDGGAVALYVRGAVEAPPVIVHTAPVTAWSAASPCPVPFQIQSLLPHTNGTARLYWAAGTSAAPTGAWQHVEAVWEGGTSYTATIPPQPPATYIHYYLHADADPAPVTFPAAGPAAPLAVYIDLTVSLTVEGAPARYGTVTPPYGTSHQIMNLPFAVSAPSVIPLSNGVRRVCAGWTGTGDIPAFSPANEATLSISNASSLTWIWNAEFALTNRYRLLDTQQVFGTTVSWFLSGTNASTETAVELGFVGSTPYAFCGWYVDGARWPDTTSAARNPAAGIPMTRPRLAEGRYLPYWQDSDANDLSDWWEIRYFGSATSGISPYDDPDGDLWTNLAEFLDNTDPNDPESQPTPPEITVTPLAPFQTARPPWTVQATITDNFTVEYATLVWRESGDTIWQTTDMTWVSGDTYAAPLLPPSHGAKRVDYYVIAGDLIGYYAPEFSSASPVYSLIGDYETPWLSLTPQSLPLLELSNAATNLALTLSNLAGPDLVWTARLAVAQSVFSPTNTGWSHSGVNDAWCVTTNRTWNGNSVWYCGNPLTRAYPNGCHAMLDTPPFRVGTAGALMWHQWIRTEYDIDSLYYDNLDNYYWDGAVIRISTDGGSTFSLITPASGYPFLITPNPDSPFPPDQPCLAGDGDGWQTLLLDLSAYAGQDVIVRFEFGSDLYVTDEGWYIADVTPLSADLPTPAWLIPVGAWGGILPDLWSVPLAFTIDPAQLAFDDEVAACLRIDSNDPSAAPLIPIIARRGHRLHLSAHGPGTASADRTFLFRGSQATVTLQADTGAYLYSIILNGVPYPGVYDYATRSKTLVISGVTEDQTLAAWFTHRIWELTVSSPYSSATPANGTYALPHGTVVNASVVSPVDLGYGIRQQCAGWTLSGNHSPASGTTLQMSFTLTNNATLTWFWHYAFRLSAQSLGNGTVSPTTNWYVAGETSSITAYPSTYYQLDVWSGDTSGATFDGNRISLVMTAPKALAASFLPNLTPTHGVPEFWLAAHGWTENFEAAASADADNDGMPTWQEWLADTDPTDPASLLRMTALRPLGDTPSVIWVGGSSRTQYLEKAASPAGPWQTVFTNLPPTSVTNTLGISPAADASFYRIRIP